MRILSLQRTHIRGCDVGTWQQFLAHRGLFSRPISGEFDDATEAATLEYQRREHIDEDGAVGPKTVGRAKRDGFVPPEDTGGGDHYALAGRVELSANGRNLLRRIAYEYYIRTCGQLVITSGTRTPAEQARAMWENLHYRRNPGVRYRNREAYDEIFSAYEHARRSGASDHATVDAMTRVIEQQVSQGEYISPHLRGEAVDVRSRTMSALQKETF